MKRFLSIFFVICILCSGLACDSKEEGREGSSAVESQAQSNTENSGVDESTQFLLDEKFNTEEYLPEYDVQLEYQESLGQMAKKDSVYYFHSYYTGDYLYYYEEATGTSGKLCGKAECVHDDQSCNAYIPPVTSSIQIYGEYIYWLTGGNMLYRCDLDGNNREMVRQLKSTGLCMFAIHRDYLYVWDVVDGVKDGQPTYILEIRQYELNNKSDEGKTLFAEDSILNTRYKIQFYGNILYLVIDQYESMTDTEWDRRIMAYHIGSGEWETIVEETTPGWIRSMYVENETIQVIEQKLDMSSRQVSVRQLSYALEDGSKTESDWITFEGNMTKGTHILPGYMFMVENAPTSAEGTLEYQLMDTDGNLVKNGNLEGLQPSYYGADDTGVFICLGYTNAQAAGIENVYKIVRIPYEADRTEEYLVDVANAMR